MKIHFVHTFSMFTLEMCRNRTFSIQFDESLKEPFLVDGAI